MKRSRFEHVDQEAVRCPKCKARAGASCLNANGVPTKYIHMSRFHQAMDAHYDGLK